jgi:hypothetical protein
MTKWKKKKELAPIKPSIAETQSPAHDSNERLAYVAVVADKEKASEWRPRERVSEAKVKRMGIPAPSQFHSGWVLRQKAWKDLGL